jgi:quercetin dioxygenase-like cupin family protein
MELYKLEDMKGGWFVGDFKPCAFPTKDFEVCYKTHAKGEKWEKHFHAIATEINLLAKGKMIIQGKEINAGDIFILKPNEIADPVFLEDCEVVVIKTPSITNDKYVVNE